MHPLVGPGLDECQACFRTGSGFPACSLLQTLHLRRHTRTYSVFFSNIPKASDVAWRDCAKGLMAQGTDITTTLRRFVRQCGKCMRWSCYTGCPNKVCLVRSGTVLRDTGGAGHMPLGVHGVMPMLLRCCGERDGQVVCATWRGAFCRCTGVVKTMGRTV